MVDQEQRRKIPKPTLDVIAGFREEATYFATCAEAAQGQMKKAVLDALKEAKVTLQSVFCGTCGAIYPPGGKPDCGCA